MSQNLHGNMDGFHRDNDIYNMSSYSQCAAYMTRHEKIELAHT